MSKSTLLVCEIKNLTEETIWVYGTSGKLIKLEPEKVVLAPDGKLAGPKPDTCYVATGFVLDVLMADARFHKPAAMAIRFGNGPRREEIYKIFNFRGSPVVPITDGIGWPGYIKPKWHNIPRFRPYGQMEPARF